MAVYMNIFRMERKERTYLGNRNNLFYCILKYIEIPEIQLFINIAYTSTYLVITHSYNQR